MVMLSMGHCYQDFDTKTCDIREEVLLDLVDFNTFVEERLTDFFKFKRVHVIGYFCGENLDQDQWVFLLALPYQATYQDNFNLVDLSYQDSLGLTVANSQDQEAQIEDVIWNRP